MNFRRVASILFDQQQSETVRVLWRFMVLLIGIVLSGGCARIQANRATARGYETISSDSYRNVTRATKKHERALKLICDGDVCGAQNLLHDALVADVSFGPAHNTLGKVYFDQGKHYLAAWEFEHASRLMPARGEPLNNLGLVYEAVGQLENATNYFAQAIELNEEEPEYLGNYLRSRIRQGDRSAELVPLLKQLIFLDDRSEWKNWAEGELVMGKYDDPKSLYFDEGEIPTEEMLPSPQHQEEDAPMPVIELVPVEKQ